MAKALNTLIIRAQEGDAIAYNQLVRQWYQRIYNFAWKYFSQGVRGETKHDLAMEVTQKTFISVHKNIPKLQDTNKFKPWLYRIASNYCFEEDRKLKRKWILPFGTLTSGDDEGFWDRWESEAPDPEGSYQHQELSEVLVRALNELSEEQRMVVIMKEYEGLKFREIAEVLEISENTAKSRMYYGLSALRRILEKWNITKETIYYGS